MLGIIFIGLQASGKSTFYQNKFRDSHVRINMDMLRTRNRESILFNACLQSKQPVVIDNTNPTKKDRAKYILGFKQHRFEVIGYYFESNLDECLERNTFRQENARIPDIGIKSTLKKLEIPDYSEGFNRLYYVKIVENEFSIREWDNEFR